MGTQLQKLVLFYFCLHLHFLGCHWQYRDMVTIGQPLSLFWRVFWRATRRISFSNRKLHNKCNKLWHSLIAFSISLLVSLPLLLTFKLILDATCMSSWLLPRISFILLFIGGLNLGPQLVQRCPFTCILVNDCYNHILQKNT